MQCFPEPIRAITGTVGKTYQSLAKGIPEFITLFLKLMCQFEIVSKIKKKKKTMLEEKMNIGREKKEKFLKSHKLPVKYCTCHRHTPR